MSARVNSGAADAERRFEEVVAAFAADRRLAAIASALRSERASGRRKAFGSGALKVNGKIFAMVARERLVVKLPKERVSAMVESGDGQFFDPGHGRLMKQWVVVLGESCSWIDLAKEAHDFVRGVGK